MITPFLWEGEQNPAYALLSHHYQQKNQGITTLHKMWWSLALTRLAKIENVNQLVKLLNGVFCDFGSGV